MLAVRLNNRTIRLEPMHPDLALIKRRRRRYEFAHDLAVAMVVVFALLGCVAAAIAYAG